MLAQMLESAAMSCLLDLYLNRLPQEAIQKDVFYVRPLQEAPADPSAPWYTAVPVGKHTLNSRVKMMCERAGIEGHKTNHSLRATAATELYQADVPEKLIQERTGHRSLKALWVYERTTTHQQLAVSSLLSSTDALVLSAAPYKDQPVPR